MSNQAHKNRIAENKRRGIFTDYDRAERKALGKAKMMQLDPSLNPAGKVKYDVIPRVSIVTPREDRSTITPKPDPAASSRGANVRANKERGTQSSSQRKVIK